jgi:hypothetical protein
VNPLEVEKGATAYLRGLTTIASTVQVHTSVSSQDVDFERPAVVVQAQNSEHRGFAASVFDIEISVRTPSMAATLADHSGIVGAIDTGVRNQANFKTAFNAAAAGMTLAGTSPPQTGAPVFEDRAWISTITVNAGIVRTT